MHRFEKAIEEKGHASFLLRGICWTTHFLGRAVRRTVGVVVFPCRAIASRFGSAGGASLAAVPKSEISVRRSRMMSELRLAEKALAVTDRGSGRRANAGARGWPAETAVAPRDNESLRAALASITALSDEVSSVLILEALHDPDSDVRCAGADAAAEAGSLNAVFSLILLLDDPLLGVRRKAKAALGRITRSKIDFDPGADGGARRKKIGKLKSWWKVERFSTLAAEVGAGSGS